MTPQRRLQLYILSLTLLISTPALARCYRCNHRDREAKHAFEVATGHPYGWHGHVVDHVIPLACGGEDSPRNMEWQTIEQGKEKDRWERNCAIWGGQTYPAQPEPITKTTR